MAPDEMAPDEMAPDEIAQGEIAQDEIAQEHRFCELRVEPLLLLRVVVVWQRFRRVSCSSNISVTDVRNFQIDL
jgi:hypothetical protein